MTTPPPAQRYAATGSDRVVLRPPGRSDPAAGGAGRRALASDRAAGGSVAPAVRVASDWTWRLLILALGLYGLTKLLSQFGGLLIPILVSLLLAALLHPVVARLARLLPRAVASLLCVLGTILLLLGLFALVGQQAVSGFADLRAQAISGLGDVQHWLSTGPLHLNSHALADYVAKARQAASTDQSTLVSGVLGVASTATSLAESAFITLFATFFFLSSGRGIWAWLLRMLPAGAQRPLDDAGRSGWVTLSHYARATLIVAASDGLGIGIGAALLGVPLALPLGVLVFLGAFIPVVGALLTGVVAVLIALVSHGLTIAIAMLGVVLLVQQIEAHVLQPFLLGRAVAVHPLAVILAIAAGATVAGIVGALFAVPIAAVGNTMITSLANRGRPGTDPGEKIAADDAPLSPDKPATTGISDPAGQRR